MLQHDHIYHCPIPNLTPSASVPPGLFTNSLRVLDTNIRVLEGVAHPKASLAGNITPLSIRGFGTFRHGTIIAHADVPVVPVIAITIAIAIAISTGTNSAGPSLLENISLYLWICHALILLATIIFTLAHPHAHSIFTRHCILRADCCVHKLDH